MRYVLSVRLTMKPYQSSLQETIPHILSANTEVLSPSVAMTEITAIVTLMIEDNVSYAKKYGLNDKAKESRERLLKLLGLTEHFNSIAMNNASLKTYAGHLFVENQNLKAEIVEINRQERLASTI